MSYLVHACDGKAQERLLLSAIEAYAGATMGKHGVEVVPYHGKMETVGRAQNQERWMSDEVRVLVGTIAFGLGINKPAVRAVIHLALPKSIEQYYEEAGRAGRDGEPAGLRPAGLLQLQDRGGGRAAARVGFVSCDSEVRGIGRVPAPVSPKSRRAASGMPKSALQQYMREWRRALAKQRCVPAFMILTDASLADLCAGEPATFEELTEVSGIGERKAQSFGKEILTALHDFAAR